MTFTLVDTHTGNLVGSHPTLESALEAVAAAVDRYGDGAIATLALGRLEPGKTGS